MKLSKIISSFFLLLFVYKDTSAHQGHRHSGEKIPFVHSIETEKVPWTHTKFLNDPNDFQFAFIADNSAAPRAGIMEKAVKALNLLHPEFVLTVGDLVQGFTNDLSVLRSEWVAFKNIISKLKPPFFYVPGNHDNGSLAMRKVYQEMVGIEHYWFIYKGVLFLCLDTEGSKGGRGLGFQQVQWAKKILKENKKVRWTMVIVHRPLWVYEEMRPSKKGQPSRTGWVEIESALQDRPYTVFSGHTHKYMKYIRKKRNYYTFATTGGVSKLRGENWGEFDHVVWITMKDSGPTVTNLMLDGIAPDDVRTEKKVQAFDTFRFKGLRMESLKKVNIPFEISNQGEHIQHYSFSWNISGDWDASLDFHAFSLKPGESKLSTSFLSYHGDEVYPNFPSLEAEITGEAFSFGSTFYIGKLFRKYFVQNPPILFCERSKNTPIIDGKIEELEWSNPLETSFKDPFLSELNIPQTTSYASWDKDNLYFAFKIEEPNMEGVLEYFKEPDQRTWFNDSIEVYLTPEPRSKDFRRLVIGINGSVYDAIRNDKKPHFAIKKVIKKGDDGWVLELAFPWKDLGFEAGQVTAGKRLGFLLVRNHEGKQSTSQFPPLLYKRDRNYSYGKAFKDFAILQLK